MGPLRPARGTPKAGDGGLQCLEVAVGLLGSLELV